MNWHSAPAYPDYVWQLSHLLPSPIYRDPPLRPGNGEPILLIPGFLAGDWTLRVLAGWLDRLGYRSYLSGIDWNIDCPNRTGELLGWRVDHILQETGQPLVVIGHSLGGMLARFLGATYPTKISTVVALGAPLTPPVQVNPIVLVASHVLYPIRRIRGRVPPECGSLECECQFQQTAFGPLPARVGFASIFSKEDEIVAWHSSLDPEGHNLEVPGRHLGLIVNRYVYQALLQVLSEGLDESVRAETGLSANGQHIYKRGAGEDEKKN